MANPSKAVEGVKTKDSPEDDVWLLEHGLRGCPSVLRTDPANVVLPKTYAKFANIIYNFEFRSDDILVLSNLRSGTTWISEMLWAMTHLDELSQAEEENSFERVFFIDNEYLEIAFNSDRSATQKKFRLECPVGREEDGLVLQLAAASKGRRVFRTHLPLALLHPKTLDTCKVIHIVRNPKDTCVSRYHLVKNVSHQTYDGSLTDFLELFMSDRLLFGDHWSYLKESWDKRHHPNLHILFYEDLKADLMKELKKLNVFLHLNLSDDHLRRVIDHSQFDVMQVRNEKNPVLDMRINFFRKGKSGSWKEELSPQADARLQNWIEKHSKGMNINFKYT